MIISENLTHNFITYITAPMHIYITRTIEMFQKISISQWRFLNVIKEDPEIRFKINIMLDSYNRLTYNYQSKTAYDSLI